MDYLIDRDLLPDAVRSGLVNKVVLAGGVNYSLLLALRRAGCHTAYASRRIDLEGVHSVTPDYRAAARLAMAHLAELGHESVAVAIPSFVKRDAFYFRELSAGCAEAWRDLGAAGAGPVLVHDERVDLESSSFFDWITREQPGTTAIFSFDDATAISLLNSAVRRGIVVPRDLSVIGCNDELRPYSPIPLTTVHFPILEMGVRLAEILDQAVDGKLEVGEPIRDTLSVELRVRESTGPVPGARA